MKFLLDENVHRDIFYFLKNLGYDIILCPRSIENGEVFNLAVREKRILITRDADFSETSIYHRQDHFGIILIRISPWDSESQKKAISSILKKIDNFKGKIIRLLPDTFEFT